MHWESVKCFENWVMWYFLGVSGNSSCSVLNKLQLSGYFSFLHRLVKTLLLFFQRKLKQTKLTQELLAKVYRSITRAPWRAASLCGTPAAKIWKRWWRWFSASSGRSLDSITHTPCLKQFRTSHTNRLKNGSFPRAVATLLSLPTLRTQYNNCEHIQTYALQSLQPQIWKGNFCRNLRRFLWNLFY